MQSERVSIREYARRINVNEKAVRKAIAAGRIVTGYDADAKKILPDLANAEWGHKHEVTRAQPGVSRAKAIEKLGASPALQPITQRVAEVSDESAAVLVDLLKGLTITPHMQVAEAMRIREVIGAGLDKIKLAEAEGRVVAKDKVEKVLYTLGNELKKALLNIPNRVVRDIMAATNEVEGINILTDEITAVLTTYGNLNKDTL